jgi:hypothetical protein
MLWNKEKSAFENPRSILFGTRIKRMQATRMNADVMEQRKIRVIRV